MIYKPNYARAQKLAYDTVKNSNQSTLPISVKKIIKGFKNLHIQKFSTFAKKRGFSLEETYELLDTKEGCLWMRKDGSYLILYNDMVDNKGRVRFTLAHELGHFLLKHNERNNKTQISRYSLTAEEYDAFEKEANYFAKRLLAPIPLIDEIRSIWNGINIYQIEDIFEVSFSVSDYLIKELNRRNQTTNIARENHELVYNFSNELRQKLESKLCERCGGSCNIGDNFCSICGFDKFSTAKGISYSWFKKEIDESMKYPGIQTNENSFATTCPRCENDFLIDNQEFCQICGANLFNKCIGNINPGDTDNWGAPFNVHNLQGCGQHLSGDARYCPVCGGLSSFYYQEILSDWKTAQEDIIMQAKIIADPFSASSIEYQTALENSRMAQ